MKRALITHDDFDGITCAILAGSIWPDIDIYYCNYKTVDSTITNILTFKQYGEIYITDIVPNEKNCELLNSCWEDKHDTLSMLALFDHHATRSQIQKFTWVTYKTDRCGAMLFYGYLIKKHKVKKYFKLTQLADVYDRWLLEDPLRRQAELMETFRKAIGNKRFFERFVENASVHLSKAEHYVTTMRIEQDATYVRNAKVIPYEINGEKCSIIFGDKLASNVCHKAMKENEVNLAVNINLRYETVELRSTGGFNAGELATKYGGGGHPEASGFTLSKEKIKRIIDIIFEED